MLDATSTRAPQSPSAAAAPDTPAGSWPLRRRVAGYVALLIAALVFAIADRIVPR